MDRVRIGISACLLGDKVRYDGGHKLDTFLADVLGPHVEWVRVCPEVEVGMGTPREPVRLVRTARTIRMITVHTGIDHTASMNAWARRRVEALAGERLSGYVLKKDSPSCGPDRVKVYGRSGDAVRNGSGLFAHALMQRFPTLPIADEGRLSDPALRENFIERIFAYRRLRALFDAPWTIDALAAFHAANELSLRAHSPAGCDNLGRLIATATLARQTLQERYERLFMQTLAIIPTVRHHALVLTRIARHLERTLGRTEMSELNTSIDAYRRGQVPLDAPLALIRDRVERYRVEDVASLTYLQPHPHELIAAPAR